MTSTPRGRALSSGARQAAGLGGTVVVTEALTRAFGDRPVKSALIRNRSAQGAVKKAADSGGRARAAAAKAAAPAKTGAGAELAQAKAARSRARAGGAAAAAPAKSVLVRGAGTAGKRATAAKQAVRPPAIRRPAAPAGLLGAGAVLGATGGAIAAAKGAGRARAGGATGAAQRAARAGDAGAAPAKSALIRAKGRGGTEAARLKPTATKAAQVAKRATPAVDDAEHLANAAGPLGGRRAGSRRRPRLRRPSKGARPRV